MLIAGGGEGKEHLVKVVSNFHRHNWASTEGLQGAFALPSGSLAGHPFGDTVFIIAANRLLNDITHRLEEAVLLSTIDASYIHDMFGSDLHLDMESLDTRALNSSFVDDTIFPFFVAPEDVQDTSARATYIIEDEFTRKGFTVNC